MRRETCLLSALGLAAVVFAQGTESTDAVLARLERNLAFKTAYFSGETIITSKSRVASKAFFVYLDGRDNFFLEYVSPERDRGQRLLRQGGDLLLYLPSARKVLKIGKGRQQSRLGSDFSLEDIVDMSNSLRGRFSAELLGDETVEGRPCRLLRLSALEPGQTYATRLLWVDKETGVALRCRYFTRSNKLARELVAGDIRQTGPRFFAGRFVMSDCLRKNSRTEIVLKEMAFDVPIPPGTFDEKNLVPAEAK
ncbi:MAG: outer membrane lipoprotein-sorting protein [Candidatus Aminicenantes bacterium]|nr:outer membrane lipoprotein-sorting protein [Candidatus Aminicenantes bacterium]